jgi:TPR repeat protein
MHPAGAQIAERPAVTAQTPAQRHADGLAMEHRKDDGGAFIAFTEAAERGHPPAQRKLGEIYDHGNPAVPRDYEKSLKWYETARENGEDIPPVRSRMPGLDLGP